MIEIDHDRVLKFGEGPAEPSGRGQARALDRSMLAQVPDMLLKIDALVGRGTSR